MSRNQALEMSFFAHYDHPAAWPHRTGAQVFSLSVCPGSRQDWVNFHSSQEGHGQDPGVIPYHLSHVVLFPCFPCVQWCRARFHVQSPVDGFPVWYTQLFVLLLLLLPFWSYCCFHWFVLVSACDLYIFIDPILLSILSQGKEWAAHGLGCFSGNTKLENTILKPREWAYPSWLEPHVPPLSTAFPPKAKQWVPSSQLL